MKQVVRHSVFETNSSSTHSISICQNSKPDLTLNGLDYDIDEGCVIIEEDEFGWGIDTFKDKRTKLSYLATYLKNLEPEEKRENLKKLKRIFEDNFHCNIRIKTNYREGDMDGYIDHQSTNTARDVFETEKQLINFIFNPNSILVIDNDNH